MALLKDNLFVDGLVDAVLQAENMAETEFNVQDYPGTVCYASVDSFSRPHCN